MTFNSSARIDDITWWNSTGRNAAGDPSYDTPVVIKGKWEYSKGIVRGADGEDRQIQHVVHLGQDVKVGDYLYLGTSVQADPADEAEAFRVQGFMRIKSIDGSKISREAML